MQRGFTLLEVMVVVVILGILAALVVPKIISRPDEARAIAAKVARDAAFCKLSFPIEGVTPYSGRVAPYVR